uniref:C3H1-type domain-containing protein n=1 Tax=Nothobranchius furzeri TaxID=105023 RepID=A0A8C6MFR5_NOTFU
MLGEHLTGFCDCGNEQETVEHVLCLCSKYTVIRGEFKGLNPCQFFLMGKCHFGNRCRLSHSDPSQDDSDAASPDADDKQDGGKMEDRKKKEDSVNKVVNKKPRMRTADDVISRILWDPSVDSSEFAVGYVDRFLGVLERPFCDFNWDTNPCDCDYSSELALPRHRIQYFTYRGQRVWDRHSRTDRVFGSTGQSLAPPFGKEEEVKAEFCKLILINFVNLFALRLQPSELPDESAIPAASPDQTEERRGGRPPKKQPTHFIAFRANTPAILSCFQLLQEELTSLLPSSAPHWQTASKLHVTLCLLVLNGPAEVAAAAEILRQFAHLDRNPPVAVTFPVKLKHFAGKVLYLSPQPQLHLHQLNCGLQEAYRKEGWLHRSSYNPRYHLTLAKVENRDGEKIFEGVGDLKVGKGLNFGRLPVNTLHLCTVGDSRVDGFFETVCKVTLR